MDDRYSPDLLDPKQRVRFEDGLITNYVKRKRETDQEKAIRIWIQIKGELHVEKEIRNRRRA